MPKIRSIGAAVKQLKRHEHTHTDTHTDTLRFYIYTRVFARFARKTSNTVGGAVDGLGAVDVLLWSMYWCCQYLRSLRECRSPAQLMFQRGQCFDEVDMLSPVIVFYFRTKFNI